jgi:hypothetical protein
MRYLRLFNESSSVEEELANQLKDYCELNLAYLLDDGMRVIVDHGLSGDFWVCVDLSFRAIGGVRWESIKDQVIPFLIRLKSEYNLKSMESFGHFYQLEVDRAAEGESGTFEYCLTIDGVINEKERILETGTIKHIRFYL